MHMIVLLKEEWGQLKANQNEMLLLLKDFKNGFKLSTPRNLSEYITANEFMQAVKIGRTKFDQLVQSNKVKTIKMHRKIYVPVTGIDRYFQQARRLVGRPRCEQAPEMPEHGGGL